MSKVRNEFQKARRAYLAHCKKIGVEPISVEDYKKSYEEEKKWQTKKAAAKPAVKKEEKMPVAKCDKKCDCKGGKKAEPEIISVFKDLADVYGVVEESRDLFKKYVKVMESISDKVSYVGRFLLNEIQNAGIDIDDFCNEDSERCQSVEGEYTEKVVVKKVNLSKEDIKTITSILNKSVVDDAKKPAKPSRQSRPSPKKAK